MKRRAGERKRVYAALVCNCDECQRAVHMRHSDALVPKPGICSLKGKIERKSEVEERLTNIYAEIQRNKVFLSLYNFDSFT